MVGQTLRRGAALALATLLALGPAAARTVLAETLAVDDSYSISEDTTLTVPAEDVPGLLANDTHDGGTPCVADVDTTGLVGAVDPWAVDGSFTFTPAANWSGETTFTYGLRALVDDTCIGDPDDEALVTITVVPVNDAPTAAADSFIALVDRTLNVGAPGVLLNDGDVDGDSLTASKVSNPAHGVVTLAADGAFSYTPTAGYRGPDAFSYRASDGSLFSPTRVVTLTVTPIPTPNPTVPPPTPAPPPTAEPTAEPSPSGSPEPSPSLEPSASASALPTASASAQPGASPAPDPTGGSGGLSLPVLVVALLLISLLAFGAAIYVPKWLERQRSGEPIDEE